MNRLGYTRYVAQGGDWGSVVTEAMGRHAPGGLLAIHVNLPATVPSEVAAALAVGGPAPDGLSEEERATFDKLATGIKTGGRAYFAMLTARPQNMGYGMADSPAGLAAWMLVHGGFTQWTYQEDVDRTPTNDQVLDDITLYWLTNTGTSAARIYWENGGGNPNSAAAQKTSEISMPVAITVFPGESYQAPRSWAERAYPSLNHYNQVDKGGHFAAWEQPEPLRRRDTRGIQIPSPRQERSPQSRAHRSTAPRTIAGQRPRGGRRPANRANLESAASSLVAPSWRIGSELRFGMNSDCGLAPAPWSQGARRSLDSCRAASTPALSLA